MITKFVHCDNKKMFVYSFTSLPRPCQDLKRETANFQDGGDQNSQPSEDRNSLAGQISLPWAD